jgi:hypothetical protein
LFAVPEWHMRAHDRRECFHILRWGFDGNRAEEALGGKKCQESPDLKGQVVNLG